MELLEEYRRAQAGFDAVLAAVPGDCWDEPSRCEAWSVRDVAGHVTWGQRQLQAWATGQVNEDQAGAPGAPHPGALAGADPLATWREARAAAWETLNADSLRRELTLSNLGETTVEAMVTVLVTDHLAHTWDIEHALGLGIKLDEELIPGSLAWARENIVRAPAFFGPERTPSHHDEQSRWLAFLGRAA
ncbi:maleylpyruvate isomerase family mycothiol-dependent enzyme [Tenggerimyces flavus]|uniref:Maleylpyruvate isomerase family mycothiol-dependent enzyme n=1 Tax=Tenggerimyces flavus TaxID=1708749 RepID=A0ABV7YN01_9ACTN|nr:maleylpyruvate isomerase family mycothiol-dependent enzyme [Tenggerimyces flavus]MBM7785757.1 uncharacterized protein (TIGR03086 family) [Tenggerimyces flavus]